jgi:hypothetical protein
LFEVVEDVVAGEVGVIQVDVSIWKNTFSLFAATDAYMRCFVWI